MYLLLSFASLQISAQAGAQTQTSAQGGAQTPTRDGAPTPGGQPPPATNLDFYLGRALQNSPLLKDYQNQVLLGQIDSQLVRASYQPQVNGNSTNLYAPTIHGWGYDQAISNGGNFTTVVAVNKRSSDNDTSTPNTKPSACATRASPIPPKSRSRT